MCEQCIRLTRSDLSGWEDILAGGRTRRLALAEGTSAGILFGTAAIFIRYLANMDAFSIAFWRLLVASLALVLLMLVLRKSFALGSVLQNLKAFAILGFFLALHFIFFISAVKDTTILNATVLVNTTPLFSVLVSRIFFRLKPSRGAGLGLLISFLGICVIAYAEFIAPGDPSGAAVLSPSVRGDIAAVLAAVVESFYLNYGMKIRGRMNILPIMLPVYLLTAVFVGLLSIPAEPNGISLPVGLALIVPLVGLGVLPTAGAHTLYFSSLSNLKPFETATMALLEPIGATILGIALFQEQPGFLFVGGAALILLGIFFVTRKAN